MNNKPFVYGFGHIYQLYSGRPEDAIPFLAVRIYENKIIFQIPAGSKLEVTSEIAREFARGIMGLVVMVEDIEGLDNAR